MVKELLYNLASGEWVFDGGREWLGTISLEKEGGNGEGDEVRNGKIS